MARHRGGNYSLAPMSRPLPDVRRRARQATLLLPDGLVARLPSRLAARVEAVRDWQRNDPFRVPGSVSPLDNVAYNRSLWNWYATRWDDREFQRWNLEREGKPGSEVRSLRTLGDEWGDAEAVQQVISEWIHPHIGADSVVGEVGTGGARIASLVAPEAGEFHAFDVAPLMLERARRRLQGIPNCHFHVVDRPALPVELGGRMDFVYSFDVFVHLDLHTQWSYLREFARVLKPGGRAFVHTANLLSEEGWKRFEDQGGYRVEGFYFVVPQLVQELCRRAGLRIVTELAGGAGNFYYERDYLALLEKPAAPAG